ncbi:MAG: redox-sensing transcriptional repressor Rex [Defluviitaleaceae bacterium]|nr:redox-sensing transcriptional repressor Rex [Defluviitaleaceae bacterium]
MKDVRKISPAVIRRLPRYYGFLTRLMERDVWRVSSKELAERMGTTASQVRQDLNNFGSFGQQGYGYNVEFLHKEMQYILGLDNQHTMVLLGASGLGAVLVDNPHLIAKGFSFVAVFDYDPKVIGQTVGGFVVQDLADLESYLENAADCPDVAVITLPNKETMDASKILAKSEIEGIWNFTGVDLQMPKRMVVESIRLADSLATLSYKINEDAVVDATGTWDVW